MGLNSTTFHGNPKYGVTKSYGLFVCRKLLEKVKTFEVSVVSGLNLPQARWRKPNSGSS